MSAARVWNRQIIMNFTVNFKSNPRVGYPFYLRERQTGMADVRYIRQQLKVNLPLDRIRGTVDGRQGYIENVEITEEIAVKTGLFENCNSIVVYVPEEWLNQFSYLNVNTKVSEETGEILRASLRPELNISPILAEWERLGFPLEIKETKENEE